MTTPPPSPGIRPASHSAGTPSPAETGITSPPARCIAPAARSPSITLPVDGGMGLLSEAILVGGGAIVQRVDWNDEGYDLVVTPLKFLRFDRDSGCCVDAPVHSKPNSQKGD